jgi:hypothetical protein
MAKFGGVLAGAGILLFFFALFDSNFPRMLQIPILPNLIIAVAMLLAGLVFGVLRDPNQKQR